MDRHDAVTFAGAAVFFVGVWLIHPPAALILAGAVMVFFGITGARS